MNAIRSRITLMTILPMLLLGGMEVSAQTVSLSLNEAIATALENNRDLRRAKLELENADAEVDEALGSAYPTIDFNARYTRNFKPLVQFVPGAFFSGDVEDTELVPVRFGADNALSASLSVNQVVFNSAVFNGVGTSKIYANISRQQLRSETSDVVADVSRAFYTALLAKQVMDVNQELLRNAEANYKDAKALYEAGLRAEFDAIRAEVAVENQRPMVVDARNGYEAALDNLKLLLGYDDISGVELELKGTLQRPPADGETEPTVEAAQRAMIENNPQIEALRLSADVNKELVTINKSEYLPTLSFFGTYQYDAQADNFGDFDFQPSLFAGLNLSINILNGGQTAAKVEQARVSYEQSRYQIAQAEAALKTQMESTLRRIEYAKDRIAASDRTIAQAERAYKIATTTYKAGTGTQLDISNADVALAQARLNQLNAVYDYSVSMAQLQNLIGQHVRLVGDDVEYRPNP